MESAAQSIVGNAVQLLGEEYRLLRGVGGQVAELRDDLEAMNALLIMQSEAEDGTVHVDRFVQVCMKHLRELAYDAEDCVDLYKLRIKFRHGGVRAKLKHLFETFFARRRLAGEIRALQARAVAIGERQARYGLNREALRRSPSLLPGPLPGPASAVDAESRRHQPVGLDDQADKMIKRLKARVDDGEVDLKVFSIVGFGGLGKTTLAMEVCRRLEVEFPHQAMVPVSQAFEPTRDLQALLKRVLQQILNPKTGNENGVREEGTLGGIDDMDAKSLAEKLNQRLQGKRYLLVIDDVWTTRAWESIQPMLPENKCGSRIIVTTRMETVAKTCSPATTVSEDCGIHRMEPLKTQYSKKLFLSRAFGSADARYPAELEDVMDNILKKCGGLPLAIVSIASILARYRSSGSKDKWEMICKSIGSQIESNPTLEGMKQIVTLSFNHLPHELKACMMYFSIFPEDYTISKDRLLNRWIAEGLVAPKRGLTMIEVATSYLDELLSRNMIEADNLEYDPEDRDYRVHDMLLEVVVSKSLEANFVSLQGGQYNGVSDNRIRRLSIHSDTLDVDCATKAEMVGRRFTEEVNVQHVRSLSTFQVQGHRLLDQLGKFKLLRVLDLEGCKGVTNKHMRYACELHLLRFLSMSHTNISEVPPQVKNLEHLQMLDMNYTLLHGLPETITQLEKLEQLDFSNRDNRFSSWRLPRGLNKMKGLRKVSYASLGNDAQVAREVGELEQLVLLELIISPETIVDEVLQELALSLSKRHSLRRLMIGTSSNDKVLNFLHSFPMPRFLQSLRIRGDMDLLPSCIGSLTYLVEFALLGTTLTQTQLFDALCKLPNLKYLGLYWKYYSNNELVARTCHKFPVLSSLFLSAKEAKVFQFEEGSMAKLEMLQIDLGNNKVEGIIGIEHLTSLKKVRLKGKEDNHSLSLALKQLKAESDKRFRSNQFQVVVKYED